MSSFPCLYLAILLGSFIFLVCTRVADVEVPQYRRCTKGQDLLRKEGPPTYDILSRNLVLSRFTRFLKRHHKAFYESHPALGVFSTKVNLLLKGFQQKSVCFQRTFGEHAFGELLNGFQRAFVEQIEIHI